MSSPATRRAVETEPLTESIVLSRRFSWAQRVDIDEVLRTLQIFPGRSVWIPDADEFAIVAPWRHRMEIAVVSLIAGVKFAQELLVAATDRAFHLGAQAVVMTEWAETRDQAFYKRAGLTLLDDVISFEIVATPAHAMVPTGLKFVRVELSSDPVLQQVISVDHNAFPWLWQNSPLEFERYLVTPGVEVWAPLDRVGRAIAYLGITSYATWGHIDRVAVEPAAQGHGLGEAAVRFAVDRLARKGALRVGLSTQARNDRSRRLYQRIGFQRTYQGDYRIYGRFGR
jgi:ribosomal protein S18 acetylase RimI-like enzyme